MSTSMNMIIAGDLAPIRNFSPIIEKDPLSVYGNLLPVLKSTDLRMFNLEAPLDGVTPIIKSGPALKGNPEHISVLSSVKAEIVSLANNHTFDYGTEGYLRTKKLLDNAAIRSFGAGMNQSEAEKPLEVECNGIRLLFFPISEGEDMQGAKGDKTGVADWYPEKLAQRIRDAKKSGRYHAVIVIAHCGLEYYPYPETYVYEAFHLWAEAGADLIVGHHPHVPQGRTFFGKTPAFFSLGNFVFYQQNHLYYRKTGYFLKVCFDTNGLVSAEPVPYRIEETSLRLLSEDEKTAFQTDFERLSKPLSDPDEARKAWEACLAWNGIDGFKAELENLMVQWQADPARAAAMQRNRVCCMQHRMQWTDGLTRIANGTINDIRQEYLEVVRDFFTKKVNE